MEQHFDSGPTQPNSSERENSKIEIGPEKAIEAFKGGRLLARVLSNPPIVRGLEDFELDYEVFQRELESLEGDGLSYASSTLILPGFGISLYLDKAAGWLFDSQESEIKHVASQDSGSSGGSDSDFSANHSDLKSLAELAEVIKKGSPRAQMNEVNANFTTKGMVGVIVRKATSTSTLLQGIILHKFMKKSGYDLPIFVYDQDKGELELLNYTDSQTKEYISQIKGGEKFKAVYLKATEKLDNLE